MLKWMDTICMKCGLYDMEMLENVGIGEPTGSLCSNPNCLGEMLRCVRNLNYKHAMQAHYNTAVGYVNNSRELDDKLKEHSERQSNYTGTEHNYERVDLREKDALGVTDEGLDSTMKRRRDTGLDAPTRSIIV